MLTRILSIYKWSHIVSDQKLDFPEEQMIFNKIAENIDSQSINTISSAMVEQPIPWLTMENLNASEFSRDKIY